MAKEEITEQLACQGVSNGKQGSLNPTKRIHRELKKQWAPSKKGGFQERRKGEGALRTETDASFQAPGDAGRAGPTV